MIRVLIDLAVRWLVWVAYQGYGAEGLNVLLLALPARYIGPLLRVQGATIGQRVQIHSPLLIHNAGLLKGRHYQNLIVGDDCYFGRDVFLDLKDKIELESNVTISMRVSLITHTDTGQSPGSSPLPASQGEIILRRGAYIGAGAIILQGVEVGSQSVIGAGAVVTRNVPPGSGVAGVPARALRETVTP